MSTWILIILIVRGAGNAVTTVEFTSAQRCDETARIIDGQKLFGITAFCVPK